MILKNTQLLLQNLSLHWYRKLQMQKKKDLPGRIESSVRLASLHNTPSNQL